MSRIRHCACRHLPERADQLLDLLKPAGFTEAQEDRIREILYRLPAGPHHHDRTLRHISAPDGHGHIYWTGPRPKRQGPHVQFKGVRMPVAMFLWLRAGRPNIPPLVRTCHDPQCIAPAHHSLKREPAGARAALLTARLAEFDLRRPRINSRPKRWDRSDPRGEKCLRDRPDAPHSFVVYGDPRLRRTYCPECNADEQARLAERKKIEDEIEWATSDSAPLHGYDRRAEALVPTEAIPDGPTLVDQLLASGAWDDHVG